MVPLAFRMVRPTLTFAVFGFPVKWKKCHGVTQYQWIGYWEDVQKFSVGISEAR